MLRQTLSRILEWLMQRGYPASGSAQSAFTKRICSTVAQFVCSSRGEAKTRLRPLPLLTATLRRSRDKRKSSPREVSSEDEAVMETSATGASCPWNLSTVPTRCGQGTGELVYLRVVRSDHDDVALANRAAASVPIRPAAREQPFDGIADRLYRSGPKKLDSFSSVFKCTVASVYAALGSGFRL